jgi:hypothetical protein
MGINQIHLVSSPIFPENLKAIGRTPPTSAGEAIARKSDEEDEIKIDVRSQANFIELQKVNEKINSFAKSQRSYQRQLQQIDDSIERMKAQLEKIMKQFPPYPPGSEDRVHALRAYAGCRKLIDQLTIPPPEEFLLQTAKNLGSVAEASEAEKTAEVGQVL